MLVQWKGLWMACSWSHHSTPGGYKEWVSEETFYWYFQGQYEKVNKYKTTTMMHILIRAPPPFRVQTDSSSCPPLGGVWPRPGSGILVYLSPEQGHPLTPPPPPHTIEWLYPPPFLCFTSSYIVLFRSFRCTIPFPSFNSHPVLLPHFISFQTYLPGPNCFHQLHVRTP
jgi:hypothetical protein